MCMGTDGIPETTEKLGCLTDNIPVKTDFLKNLTFIIFINMIKLNSNQIQTSNILVAQTNTQNDNAFNTSFNNQTTSSSSYV